MLYTMFTRGKKKWGHSCSGEGNMNHVLLLPSSPTKKCAVEIQPVMWDVRYCGILIHDIYCMLGIFFSTRKGCLCVEKSEVHEIVARALQAGWDTLKIIHISEDGVPQCVTNMQQEFWGLLLWWSHSEHNISLLLLPPKKRPALDLAVHILSKYCHIHVCTHIFYICTKFYASPMRIHASRKLTVQICTGRATANPGHAHTSPWVSQSNCTLTVFLHCIISVRWTSDGGRMKLGIDMRNMYASMNMTIFW